MHKCNVCRAWLSQCSSADDAGPAQRKLTLQFYVTIKGATAATLPADVVYAPLQRAEGKYSRRAITWPLHCTLSMESIWDDLWSLASVWCAARRWSARARARVHRLMCAAGCKRFYYCAQGSFKLDWTGMMCMAKVAFSIGRHFNGFENRKYTFLTSVCGHEKLSTVAQYFEQCATCVSKSILIRLIEIHRYRVLEPFCFWNDNTWKGLHPRQQLLYI